MIWIARAVCIPQVRTIFQQILGAFFALVSSANFLHVHSTKHVWCMTTVNSTHTRTRKNHSAASNANNGVTWPKTARRRRTHVAPAQGNIAITSATHTAPTTASVVGRHCIAVRTRNALNTRLNSKHSTRAPPKTPCHTSQLRNLEHKY